MANMGMRAVIIGGIPEGNPEVVGPAQEGAELGRRSEGLDGLAVESGRTGSEAKSRDGNTGIAEHGFSHEGYLPAKGPLNHADEAVQGRAEHGIPEVGEEALGFLSEGS